VLLSDITLWEIAALHEFSRIQLDRPLREWLETAAAPPKVHVEPITPEIAAQVAQLPASFHRYPADRLIVATAMTLGARLATADVRIRQSCLVPTIP
jgi:PIN domain nuclease of toxin-antitoxin system